MEEWRHVRGFKGYYEVSSLGRVRSVERRVRSVSKSGRPFTRVAPACLLKPGASRGYRVVNLSKRGVTGMRSVHRLVAVAFLPGRKHSVNHINGIKSDNRRVNLEWVTRRENQLHAVALGLKSQALKVRGKHVKTGITVAFPPQNEAAFFCTGNRNNGTNISSCLRGETPHVYGYRWCHA